MKKQLSALTLLLGLGALTTTQVQAQSFLPKEIEQIDIFQKHKLNSSLFFAKQIQAQNDFSLKPTATQQRIKSYVYAQYDGVFFIPNDSISFHWIGTNSNKIDFGEYIVNFLANIPDYNHIKTPKERFLPIDMGITSDSSLNHRYDPAGSLYEPSAKTLSQFDANGNLTEQISLRNDTGIWKNNYKYIYAYNSNNELTSYTRQNWDGVLWLNNSKYTYDYDANGNLTLHSSAFWDNASSSWENDNKYISTYNAQNLLTEQVHQRWNVSQSNWDNISKSINTYNTNNKLSSTQNQSWNNTASQWVNNSSENISYDGNFVSNVILSSWDDINSNWSPNEKIIFTYNSTNQIENIYFQTWNNPSSVWNYTYKYNKTYSGNNVTAITVEEWDNVSSQFVDLSRIAKYYNSNDLIEKFNLMEADSNGWSFAPGNLEFRFQYEEYDDGVDSNDNSGITRLLNNNIQLYPNPAKDILNIKLDKNNINHIKVIDLNGKVVFKSKTILNTTEIIIPTSQLANGLYFVQIQSGSTKGAKSFVIQR